MGASTSLGSKLYALHDKQLGGFITWQEKGTSAIFLFTNSDLAERYAHEVHHGRPLVVYLIHKSKARDFVGQMLNAGIEYALINVPPEHADTFNVYEDEVVRNYAIVNLRKVNSRLS
jgi:hypothetical protein